MISGLSGSGKSSAVKALEDAGYFCVDNLPVPVLAAFFELSAQSSEGIQKLAFVIDARDKKHIGKLPTALDQLTKKGHMFELVFLEASDEILARRFSETRRRHPLSPDGSVAEGVAIEKKLLAPLRKIASHVIDTSELNPRDLRQKMLQSVQAPKEENALAVQVTSFGFKYGLPVNADMVMDVRFLPNPFFKEELKDRRGTDSRVVDFVLAQKDTMELLALFEKMLKFLLPRFDREGKSYLHLAVGCTGGRHRSVVIAGRLAMSMEKMGYHVTLSHRDLDRD